MKKYDIIIIGAGPAGLTAALYGARSKKSVLVLEKEMYGGQMMITSVIENVPGGDNDPFALASRMKAQAVSFGAEFKTAEVTRVELTGQPKTVVTSDETYEAGAVILATGAHPRKLGLEGEEKFTGRGLGYCATCDGPFFAGQPIYVVGGGDAAFDESLYLATLSSHVTILYRGNQPRAAKILQQRVADADNIEVRLNTEVVKLSGDEGLGAMVLQNNVTGQEETVSGPFGLFIYAGMVPNTALFEGQVEMTPQGYIVAGENTDTNVSGVFVAGDVRTKEVRQIVCAMADGATAAIRAGKFLDAAAN